MSADKASDWDRYWAHGFLTSCADVFASNYEGQMRSLWERHFSRQPDGARILDICTGNGAIALIAAAIAQRQDKKFFIDALDLAEIHPERAVDETHRSLLDGISFHPLTDAAETGLAEAGFDFISGHFALEYTDVPRTIAELARLTAVGGEHLFLLHHNESVILKTAREELEHFDLLFHHTAIFDHAEDLIKIVGSTLSSQRSALAEQPAVEKLREALNDAAARLTNAQRKSNHPEMLRNALGGIAESYKLAQKGQLEAGLQTLHESKAEIEANAARLGDLLSAASDKHDLGKFREDYLSRGFSDCTISTLEEEQIGLIGWILHAQRNIA